ncbi:MAG: potassium transporter Kup [Acidimicrobiia bacterium]|nr:potassium transporter Kup [Acidimicrobiia bacterium]
MASSAHFPRPDAPAPPSADTDRHADASGHAPRSPRGRYLLTLSIAALGVVYGDIGTSPLYAIRECFHGPHAITPTPANVMGVLSLVFWALVLVISGKYLTFVLRADNDGEGGILALTALATPIKIISKAEKLPLVLLGIFGAALLYGDGMITPAISVLSAVEGLQTATPVFAPYVVPITIAILVGLFLIQSHGTGGVGRIFGPVTFVWFATLGVLGAVEIARHPAVLASINPVHAIRFFTNNGWTGYLILGTVVLAITGGESLYVDLGHFGKRPIRLVWFAVVMPALLLNYFGQGALLINDPEAAHNPFYLLAPSWALYPMVALATAATVIASQAVISGAFSISMQAVQFGFLPRLLVTHTSSTEVGQIYIPSINWALMAACILLVLGFRSSSNLAAAYGVAVISTMTITSIMFFVVAHRRWGWSLGLAVPLVGVFLTIDLAFLGANLIKIPQGGWFPIVAALVVLTIMTTWRRGRRALTRLLLTHALPVDEFMRRIQHDPPLRVPGTAVFMNGNQAGMPPALLHNVRHNHVLHERNILLTAKTTQTPRVNPEERVQVEALGEGFWRVTVNYGFTEEPDIPTALATLRDHGLGLDLKRITYFLGRETLIPTQHVEEMAIWRETLFVTMARNASNATRYFRLPPAQVIEVGAQLEI